MVTARVGRTVTPITSLTWASALPWQDRQVTRRIVHVSDSYLPGLGGIETQIAYLGRQQAAAGNRVGVVTTTPGSPGAHGLSRAVEDGLDVYRIAARIPGGYPIHLRAGHHVTSALRSARPDVVHLHMGILAPTAQATFRVVRRLELPAVVTVHSVWGPGQERALGLLDRLVRGSRFPVELATVSEMAAAPLRRVAGDRAPIHVLRNGVDVGEWLGEPLPRERAGVHAVYAARFAPRKRVLPLLEALRRTRDLLGSADDGALHVTIAGEGEELGKARAFLEANDMADWVSLPGRLSREELKSLYRRADVYLAPGVLDAFSVASQEAQAAGLAIVTRSQSGAAELVTHEVEGLLADDDDAFAAQLARLVREPALLERIVTQNRTVPPRTAWDAVVGAHDAVYDLAQQRYAR